ncbi:A disintegrin and metalloproteinase with thrombospondin motifs adt-1-like [Pomacea canaliculata]|uniref:A disintegrin and metalloproteinase with thrombospondin motifs adt-1-like n=1 Tax=Pomacea canaliculata TaxID=400727 RepID=UPI000D7330ED|nr:A disintegrin and metalloproteinase with thrombospondin motifs adt-1-like [Pomacea canaliculata]
MDKMSILMVCLMAALSEAALHEFSLQNVLDNAELMDHARRVARAADAAGYEIATLYGESLESGEHRRLTKRDVEDHVASPSSKSRNFELLLTSGERLHMSLQKRQVLCPNLKVVERLENETIISRPLIKDCFFSGLLRDKSGFASLSLCDGNVVGAIQSKDRNFQLLPLPEDFTRKFPFLHVLLTWSNTTDNQDSSPVDNFVDVSKDEVNKLEDEEANNEKVKRSVRDRKVTIEVGVYLDVHFLNKVSEKHQISSNQQLTDFIAQKWSGIAGVLHNPSLVGWDITIKVVNVEIWRSNPWWYQDSTQELGERMQSACENTMDQPFDYVSIETSDTDPPRRTGVAYVGQMCNPRYRCGITKGANFNFAPEIHEMGHNMGLKHDDTMSECSRQEKGFMSAKQSVFRPCYAKVLDYSLRDKSCLFEDSVDTSNYNPINLE